MKNKKTNNGCQNIFFYRASSMLQSDKTFAMVRVFLGDLYPGIYLTKRESEYVLQALRGKRRKTIANDMRIGVRTLDSYIKSIKAKLGCRCSQEILDAIEKTDFIKNASN